MDDRRFGLAVRALRRRLGWRQRDLALHARVRQQEVSDIERGRLDDVRIAVVRRISSAVNQRASLDLLWRGGALDRLIDQRHAELVEHVASVLSAAGWRVRPEVSFAESGDRGSLDLLAWHETTRVVLVVEVKTELTSVEETLRRFDVKMRVAAAVARALLGWSPDIVASALVLPETATARRRVADHATTFKARLPDHGRQVRAWLREPGRPFAAIWFLSPVPTVGGKRTGPPPYRVRRMKSPPPVAGGR